jgi:hypothetical protein
MPDKNDFFTCSARLTIRSAMAFRNDYMMGYYAKYREDGPHKNMGWMGRKCIDCEIRYTFGGKERFEFGGKSGGFASVCWASCQFVSDARYKGPGDYWTCLCCKKTR